MSARKRLVDAWMYGTLIASIPFQVVLGALAVAWTQAEAWRRSL